MAGIGALMRVVLVFPPPWEPTMPYLALPLLAGSLRERGIDVVQVDAALSYNRDLLAEETLRRLTDRLAHSNRLLQLLERERRGRWSAMVRLGKALAPRGPAALRVLTRAELFSSSSSRRQAWQLLEAAHLLAGSAHFPTRLGPDSLAVRRNPLSSEELLLLAGDERENPYRAHIRERVVPRVLTEEPGLVGISVVEPAQLPAAATIALALRAARPELPVVAGGPFFTLTAQHLPRFPRLGELFSAIVVGDGEAPLAALCSAPRRRWAGLGIPGVLIPGADSGPAASGAPASGIPDARPWFDPVAVRGYLSPSPVLPLRTQRGCYHARCAFCAGIEVFGRRFVERPLEQVLAAIEHAAGATGARHFFLADQATTPRMLAGLSRALLERGEDRSWFAQVRFEPGLRRELLALLRRAGCRMLVFGLESAVERVRRRMEKGGSLRVIRRILRDCAELGIAVHLFLIAGFPGETLEEAEASVHFVLEAPAALGSSAHIHPFVLELGSAVERHPERYGVRIFPPPPSVIPYQLDYEVEEGMSHGEALAFAREAEERLAAAFPAETPSLAHRLLLLERRGVWAGDGTGAES
jgi:hypothetical protein